MIEQLSGFPDGTLGFRLTGKVTEDDYEDVLTPAIDEAIGEHDRTRLLMQVGPDFDGYELEAAWDDAKLGLRHWQGFERIAVVSDESWIKAGVRALGFLMPCPSELFALTEQDEARRWLSESLGSIHLDSDDDLVIIRLLGKLEPSAYDSANEEIDGLMAAADEVRLLLDLREFDGWSGLAGLGEHLSLVRAHYRVPMRIAVVGDNAWQRLAEKLMSRFVNARTSFFDSSDYDGGVAWVKA